MQAFDWSFLWTMLHRGIDPAGILILTGLLTVSAWTCLSASPAFRQAAVSAGQLHKIYLLCCALSAPLLMFGALSLVLLADPALQASHAVRGLVWLLYTAAGLQQLFALQRLAFWPAPQVQRLLPLIASALGLLPAAMWLALLALEQHFFAPGSLPRMAIGAAAGAAVSGLVLWLPVQLLGCARLGRTAVRRTRPVVPSMMRQAPVTAQQSACAAPSAALEMEIRLQELSELLEQEKRSREQEQLRQDELLQVSIIQQQVNAQKFLFESGLTCNLAMLVNGLIILELPLDLRDHVRGDTLLHAAVRERDPALVRQLLEQGANMSLANWAGETVRASTQEPAIQALLNAFAATVK